MSSQSRKHLPQLSACSSNIEDIMSRAYDSYDIQLSSLQFLYSKPGTQGEQNNFWKLLQANVVCVWIVENHFSFHTIQVLY